LVVAVGRHAPLLKSVLAAAVAYYTLIYSVHESIADRQGLSFALPSCVWFLAGALYTHLFEYAYHRLALHRGLKGLLFIREGHMRHHRIFYGDRFRSRNPEALRHVTNYWYTFPLLASLHYALFSLFVPSNQVPALFLGITAYFVCYETSHWFTHAESPRFDALVRAIPLLGAIWLRQVEHHRQHHLEPLINFNFTAPFLGDRLFATQSAPGAGYRLDSKATRNA
jgi:hypothetical protein